MTYREKLIKDYPGLNWDRIDEITRDDCPSDYGYEDPICCSVPTYCEQCWLREIPEEEPKMNSEKKKICRECEYKEKGYFGSEPKEWVCIGTKHPFVIEDLDRECTEMLRTSYTINEVKTSIKDSGDRTEFETGAVRDMRQGKGRFDLMPLEVVAKYIEKPGDDPGNDYWFFWNINGFKLTGNTDYLYSAMHTIEADAFEYTFDMLLEVSKHFEDGAVKYGENNWQKGIPTNCYIDSAMRHYVKWRNGMKDEPHARAVFWNLMCCIWEVDYREKNTEETK